MMTRVGHGMSLPSTLKSGAKFGITNTVITTMANPITPTTISG